ncbi:WXG100 family type VII secretion target [Streptomyces sp. NPDC002669]|uniref:WXG100 family type VII secretion target n=1 Tax=unclassified Streptomyces TaxID=2593676 RepID=UPI0036962863
MSGNIRINWGGFADATNDMQQLTANMRNALEELIGGVQDLARNAEGKSADTWRDVQTQLNAAISKMDNAFNQGHQTLSNMGSTHHEHDGQGAKVMAS